MEENTVEINSIEPDSAHTVCIRTKDHSYGIFCFNSKGDLFVNSDWGFYGYAWRAFGSDFQSFLASTNAYYMVGKFEINYRETNNKKMPAHRRKNVERLCAAFIDYLNAKPSAV